ncbi:hypothetical protein OPW36_02805 [Vibrio europaeus]|uniref:hypothetical protein n=1 Tax=Vibrio europaeus TaxID=300876 RepID=UPI00233F47E4|nr:hypothetical protein [Vibrio europaeus]MDC5803774.1 hypothetical protein [Vibrio europaeus]MDC5823647.1 hypothetical protein [Vibrio europaeus]MDC5828517.1 hypothetical protein [Vibrio europaeus]MDC5833379.1 hypothetical protein [Vibrio europaeus]
MSIKNCDTEEYYYRTIDLSNDMDVEALVCAFIDDISEHAESLNCKIEDNNQYVASFEFSDYEELNMRLEDIDDKSKVKIELKCEKKNDRTLRVIDPETFISSISGLGLDSQLKFWLEKLRADYDSVLIGSTNVELSSYQEHVMASFVERHRKDTILTGVRMNVCYLEFLLELFVDSSHFFYHLLEMRTVLCLCLISRSCNLEDKLFEFDGGHQIDLKSYGIGFSKECGQSVYQVFQWAYNDERLSARIGVINQVISQSKNVIKIFDTNVIRVLDSIYQVYIKEDFEQYIEVRNRTSDSTLDLCNRINDSVSASRSTIKQSIFVILSYFFSIIVFTAIDKGKVENILTLELTVLSSVFLVAAFLSIWIANGEMNKNIEIYKYQLEEIKKRNRVFLSEEEISDFFQSKSLSESLRVSESKNYLYISLLILVALAATLWYFHLTSSSLTNIPVLLHIV